MEQKKWAIIINPTSGNGKAKTLWPKIKTLLDTHKFSYDFQFTEHEKHSVTILQSFVLQGFTDFICVGGDGTIHNMVNAIMDQKHVDSNKIRLGVIPIGTGNDWIKTHDIPKNIEDAVLVIKQGKTAQQDLGKMTLQNDEINTIYFNNLAGIGFDGFVVSKVNKYKHFGAVAYLVGALIGIFSFKNFNTEIRLNSKVINCKSLMVLAGLCKYSGGGMQLTKEPDYNDGLLDISIAKNFTTFDILKNIAKLFNGKIVNFNKVETYKAPSIQVKNISDNKIPIQADGELVGYDEFSIEIVPNALTFIIP